MSDPNAAYTSEEARIRDIKYSYNNVYDYKNVGITTYVCAHKNVSMIYNACVLLQKCRYENPWTVYLATKSLVRLLLHIHFDYVQGDENTTENLMCRDRLMIAISIIHIRYLCCIYYKNTRLHEFKMITVIQTSLHPCV